MPGLKLTVPQAATAGGLARIARGLKEELDV
jgi:hypothetical protein